MYSGNLAVPQSCRARRAMARELSSRPCVLSCPAKISIRTVCCHCLAKARVCPTAAVWGDYRGKLWPSSWMNSGASASPRSRRALVRVHWRSLIVIAGKRCEISKALRQRSSAIGFPACQRSIGENANGLTDEAVKGVQSAATCIVATAGLVSRNRSS